MHPFTAEAAEQIISVLCYSRTEDTYRCHSGTKQGKGTTGEGGFRLAVALKQGLPRLTLSDSYNPAEYQTITVADSIRQGLLAPSWEDLAAKLHLNDQDILYMCLMSREEPLRVRFIEVQRIKAYRDGRNKGSAARKPTNAPERVKRCLGSPQASGRKSGRRGHAGARLRKGA